YYINQNSNIIVSYCGASEIEKFRINKTKKEIRKILNLSQDKYIIGYIGNLGLTGNYDHYRLDIIIKSLVYLSENVVFVAVGDREGDSKWLMQIAKEANVSDRVFCLPWQKRDNVPLYYLSFDLLYLPRREKDMEGDSPLKMFEYLAVGVPIIAAGSLSIKEVLKNEYNSIIVDSNDPKDWAHSIVKIKSNNELKAKLIFNSAKSACEYTWDKRAEKIFNFIKNI
ncbi:MAG: glycosyltransferase, partial [Candidatus Helarchaeota archaeon]